jgi:hypothetical protein
MNKTPLYAYYCSKCRTWIIGSHTKAEHREHCTGDHQWYPFVNSINHWHVHEPYAMQPATDIRTMNIQQRRNNAKILQVLARNNLQLRNSLQRTLHPASMAWDLENHETKSSCIHTASGGEKTPTSYPGRIMTRQLYNCCQCHPAPPCIAVTGEEPSGCLHNSTTAPKWVCIGECTIALKAK